ncbi:MAG: VWA domain-containing protein [Planctomycetota bacterium]|nr:VWA domain-containing protein [Planctomycetota bacterium]
MISIGSQYSRGFTRANPSCYLFLIDQSLGMGEPIEGNGPRRCDFLADRVNNWLNEMILRASTENSVRGFLEIAVIGYHTDEQGNPIIQSALPGDRFIPISQIALNTLRIDEKQMRIYDEEIADVQEFSVQIPVWIDPVARGGSPMCAALCDAYYRLESWIANHPYSFPPIVIHITEGEAQDGDPVEFAEPLRSLSTCHGELLLFNFCTSAGADEKTLFPSRLESHSNRQAIDLFNLSSLLPAPFYERAAREHALHPGARAFAYGADVVTLNQFLEVSSPPFIARHRPLR